MPKCIKLLPCDWLIRNLCYQAIEQVYLIKWPMSAGTYCCVFITLLQKRIVAVQNENIWGLSIKCNALSCCKYALHQTQTQTYLIVITNAKLPYTTSHFNFLICRFELLCRIVITQDLNRSCSPPKYISVLREIPNKLTVHENP